MILLNHVHGKLRERPAVPPVARVVIHVLCRPPPGHPVEEELGARELLDNVAARLQQVDDRCNDSGETGELGYLRILVDETVSDEGDLPPALPHPPTCTLHARIARFTLQDYLRVVRVK